MKPSPGDVIGGKYRIVRLIGDGGMGTVYEAHHEFLDTNVALKFLHSELAKRAGLGSRFLQEARVSARIHSPHVTHVTDVDQTADGSPYLVMELLHGESLQSTLDRRTKLPVEQAIDFALQILSGLESAHAIGVVHRDLKPDNVFVVPATGGPLLKLIDFGIAKLRASTEYQKGLTRAGVIMGTPEYMAPEQLFAAESVDLRADLYSLGVILFEMLSGKRPADGDDVEAIVAQVVAGNVRKLATLEPSLSPGLVAVVERATLPDREARFSSAHEMRLALAPFAGALSHAGRLAASPEPISHHHSADAGPALTGPSQVFSVERAVPKTLPPSPEAAMLNEKGGTQEVSDEALQEALRASAASTNAANFAYLPTTPAYTPAVHYSGPPPRRKSRTGLWVAVSLLVVLGLGGAAIAAVFYEQQQSSDNAPVAPIVEDPAAPPTTVTGLVDTSGVTPPTIPNQPPVPFGTTPSHPVTPGPTVPRVADAGAPGTPTTADAGRTGFPFPFPIPSVLPPLPSNFPALPPGFPTTLPTTLPSGFPVIPGLNFPKAAKKDGGL